MNRERNGGSRIGYALGFLALLSPLAWADSLERLTGTVRTVDPRTHTVVLLTGVGHALRVVRVVVSPGLGIAGAPDSAAARLTPGCIVRIECRRVAAGMVASTVSLVRPAPRGVKP